MPIFYFVHGVSSRLIMRIFMVISVVFLVNACSLLNTKTEIIRITGYGTPAGPGKPAPKTPPVILPEINWMGDELTAVGMGKPPEDAEDETQGALIARSAAKRDALRNLADIVMALKINPVNKVEDFLEGNPPARDTVTKMIADAEVGESKKQANGLWRVEVRMNPYPIAEMVQEDYDKKMKQFEEERKPVELSTEEQQKARVTAFRDAFTNLLSLVGSLRVGNGIIVDDLMFSNPAIRTQVITLLQRVKTDQVRFLDDGSCEVTLEYDIAKIRKEITYP